MAPPPPCWLLKHLLPPLQLILWKIEVPMACPPPSWFLKHLVASLALVSIGTYISSKIVAILVVAQSTTLSLFIYKNKVRATPRSKPMSTKSIKQVAKDSLEEMDHPPRAASIHDQLLEPTEAKINRDIHDRGSTRQFLFNSTHEEESFIEFSFSNGSPMILGGENASRSACISMDLFSEITDEDNLIEIDIAMGSIKHNTPIN